MSGVKKAWAEGCWRGGRHRRSPFSQPRLSKNTTSTESPRCGNRLLSVWSVDILQALRMCEYGQVEVNASDESFVSWDRVEDLWPTDLV